MASATSFSFCPVCCECAFRRANASSAVMSFRPIKMPIACSMIARRPKAPCKLLNSAKRRSVISSVYLSSAVGVSANHDVGEDAPLGGFVDEAFMLGVQIERLFRRVHTRAEAINTIRELAANR